MTKIHNIKYYDSAYSYAEKLPSKIELKIHECIGYVKKKKDYIHVSFVIEKNKTDQKGVMGLIIPNNALISSKSKIRKIIKGAKVAITWADIVYFKNTEQKEYSTMCTKGEFVRQGKNFIIIKNPETIRINPKPIKNHPVDKPKFYCIHSSVITKISEIK